MLRKLTSALLLGAMLVFCASVANAQPVDFTLSTSTGNDTLFVGYSSSINFDVNANGAGVASFTLPFLVSFSNGNIIGPVVDGTNWVWDPKASVFESLSFLYGNGSDPDSLLGGTVDFGGTLWDYAGTNTLVSLVFSPTDTGTITIDSVGLPPSNHLSAVDAAANLLDMTWAGPYTFTVVNKPNEPPVITDCGGDVSPNPAVFGNLVTATIGATDPDNAPVSPLNYFVVGGTNSNGTGPNNAPSFVGNQFQWQTSSANNDDVGTWVWDVGVEDGKDTAYCSFTVEVIGQTPFVFCIDTLSALSNQDVSVCITMAKDAGLQVAGGFDLLICYDASVLTFNSATVGQALLDNNWEYWTYRLESTNPGKVRIVAIADMNNSNHHPSGENPVGVVTCLNFHTSNDRTIACQKAPIRFCWEDCGDNTVSSADGYVLYVAGGEIIDVGGGNIYGLTPDPWGYNATVVDAGCPSDKYEVDPFVNFCNGAIRIICPGEIDARGDINLNGLAYEIADAVLFSNYLIWGTSVLDPIYYEAQIAASDVNNDGAVLTLADLVYLIRVITGDATPIADGLGGPKVAGIVGQVKVESAQQGSSVTVKSTSDQDLGAGLFIFNYSNTEISSVTAVGAASNMDVEYRANDGELRVLVYNVGTKKIAAGSGEILNITTTGGGTVELTSAEAASYMGGKLESNVSAKMVPTAYALHQNYPNPFNPSTSMALDFPTASNYTLNIYNIAGQVVKTYSGYADAGVKTITWDGTNSSGTKVASGVYFYRAEMGNFSAVKKMVLMK